MRDSYVPKTSYQRDALGYYGVANNNFITFLFSEQAIGTHFLKDAGLIRTRCSVTPAVGTCYLRYAHAVTHMDQLYCYHL
jgi:hypothetical protein